MAFADELRDGTWKVSVPDFPFEDVMTGLITAIEVACKHNASKGVSKLFLEGSSIYVMINCRPNTLWFDELCQKVGESRAKQIEFMFFQGKDICRYPEHEKKLKETLSAILWKMGFKELEQYEYVSMHNGRVSLVAVCW